MVVPSGGTGGGSGSERGSEGEVEGGAGRLGAGGGGRGTLLTAISSKRFPRHEFSMAKRLPYPSGLNGMVWVPNWRTVNLPSDWRAMARLGTRRRERASMTKSRPPIDDRWIGEEGREEAGEGGCAQEVLPMRLEVKLKLRRSGFSRVGIGQNPRSDWPSGAGELPSVKTATIRDRVLCVYQDFYLAGINWIS